MRKHKMFIQYLPCLLVQRGLVYMNNECLSLSKSLLLMLHGGFQNKATLYMLVSILDSSML